MKKSIKRLQEYIDNDFIYQESKKGYEPSHNDGSGDFERFCIEHCGDIEKLLDAYMEQVKRNGALQYALCAVREKWNNDKARYRRKAKRYRFIIKELENFIEEEKNRLARECSQIYEDSLGKTHLVSEDIYNELTKISNKIQESKENN